MPGGDRSGPRGMGPMTGRGAGFCAGSGAPGYANPMPRGGLGRGRGGQSQGGRGRRNMFWATGLPGWMRLGLGGAPSATGVSSGGAPEVEKQSLEQQAERLQAQLSQVQRRLGKLSGGVKQDE